MVRCHWRLSFCRLYSLHLKICRGIQGILIPPPLTFSLEDGGYECEPAAPATQTSWPVWPSWCKTAAGCSSALLPVLEALPPFSARWAPLPPDKNYVRAGLCRDAAALRPASPALLLPGTLTHKTGQVCTVSGATAPGDGVWSMKEKAQAKWTDDCIWHKWPIQMVQK